MKQLHKLLALAAFIYFFWMGLSGIALNHPQQLREFSLPNRIMPDNYQYHDWNRMSWRDAAFSRRNDKLLYVAGKEGVWKSFDQGHTFTSLSDNFPTSAYDKDTFSILPADHDHRETLFAGTRSGLFYLQQEKWHRVTHPLLKKEPVIELIQVDQQILAFTRSAAFKADITEIPPLFTPLPLPRKVDQTPRIPLFRWLRKVHDGSIFGFKGRLLVDLIGFLLLFLVLSGGVTWYVITGKRRHRKPIFAGKIFALNYRWHLKLGIIGALFIAVTALSGAFSHPPLLLTIIRLSTPSSLLPQKHSVNPWDEQIQKAAYLKSRKRLIIATKQGLFSGPIDGSRNFIKLPDTMPIHGMGVQVFESLDDNRLLVGSFSGLFLWDTAQQIVLQLKAKPRGNAPDWGRPIMVSGAAVYNGEPLLAIDYESGIKPLRRREQLIPTMPNAIKEQSRISLWHALFELHNGRIFEQYIGPFYWLITPVGGILLCIILASGCLLWLRRRYLRGKTAKIIR
jgi:uncharacterized iron-regulated membrane protein